MKRDVIKSGETLLHGCQMLARLCHNMARLTTSLTKDVLRESRVLSHCWDTIRVCTHHVLLRFENASWCAPLRCIEVGQFRYELSNTQCDESQTPMRWDGRSTGIDAYPHHPYSSEMSSCLMVIVVQSERSHESNIQLKIICSWLRGNWQFLKHGHRCTSDAQFAMIISAHHTLYT